MTDSPNQEAQRAKDLERNIQATQIQPALSDLLYRYKTNNGAIKHLAIFSMESRLLARTPDEEAQSHRLLELEYEWLANMIGPLLSSTHAAHRQYEEFALRTTAKHFGKPNIIRMGMMGGEEISQIYARPLDVDALLFLVATARANRPRNAIVVNEGLLLDDMEQLAGEVLALIG
jgi:hypothetical protein